MTNLEALGWAPFFEQALAALPETGFEAGRVAIENKGLYLVYTSSGEYTAEISGRLLFTADSPAELPKVGDWVAATVLAGEGKAIIHHVLPRRSKFSRKEAGNRTDEQIIAANVDLVFIVQSLDEDFNLRRLERYLVMAYESGARPVILLNKADLGDGVAARVAEVQNVAAGAPALVVSAKTEQGLESVRQLIRPGLTIAFIGSSGVGKSTLINKLVGHDLQKIGEVRQSDAKGRHTTTTRELIVLPQGGLVVDTPGMRELHLWSAEEGLADAFADIDRLAASCHFSDCTHTREIKCAVLAAVEDGRISPDRYRSYLKLQKELAYVEEKQDHNGYLARRRRDKEFGRYKKTKHRRT